jgi:prolyl-tRNA editing enzyme YbaK/EbsC (Cys-tRNA(Pro) deacylase)
MPIDHPTVNQVVAVLRAADATDAADGAVALPEPAPTAAAVAALVDVDLEQYPTVWAAAGHTHTVFPTSYAELLRITGGRSAVVARP